MAELPVPSLARARESKISELSTFFANDDLSLEELERRIERVYKTVTLAELDAITADIRSSVAPREVASRGNVMRGSAAGVPSYTVENARVLSLLSSTRRVGRWSVPQHLDVVAVMSDTRLDMTHASLPGGIIDLELRCVMAAFKLIVPPNVRVINETHAVMSNIASRADEVLPGDAPASAGAPIIRLMGYAFMSEVKIVVRRVEDVRYGDDDDDDDD